MTFWRKILNTLNLARPGGGCHGEGVKTAGDGLRKVGIVGSPNVGKSAVFNSLTGVYVTVSNYPGTTVNVSKGKAKIEGEEIEVIDTSLFFVKHICFIILLYIFLECTICIFATFLQLHVKEFT